MFGALFQRVPKWDMQQAREFINSHNGDDYELVDVREPQEFAEGHLPGAKLIPLGELAARLEEIERGKPALVYCRSGARAGTAVSLLNRAGYDEAVNIGGLLQWDGLVATGAPEASSTLYDSTAQPEDYLAMASAMEQGAERFYLVLAERFPQHDPSFEEMAVGEQRHAEILARVYSEETGKPLEQADREQQDLMEGGIRCTEACTWAQKASLKDVLEFTVAMEANAQDRYLRLGRAIGGEYGRLFAKLAISEQEHRDVLLQAFLKQRR